MSRGQASERSVCVHEAVEKGARRPPLPAAVAFRQAAVACQGRGKLIQAGENFIFSEFLAPSGQEVLCVGGALVSARSNVADEDGGGIA